MRTCLIFAASWVLVFCGWVRAEPATTRPVAPSTSTPATQPSSHFLRWTEQPDGSAKLEAAINTYRNDAGVTVHLIATLHVADRGYYTDLAKTFHDYDVLLFEMVRPKGMPMPRPGQAHSKLSSFQRGITDMLGLDFQLDAIDYRQPNFVNADLSYEDYVKLSDQRGESVMGLMLRAASAQMAREMSGHSVRQPSPFELIAAFASPDSHRQLKLLMGRQFADMESISAGLDGPKGSVLLTERNKAALSALKDQIAAGKKNIGIFYGAAHMPNMEKHLIDDMGFHHVDTEWRTAWDIAAPAATRPAATTRPAVGAPAVAH